MHCTPRRRVSFESLARLVGARGDFWASRLELLALFLHPPSNTQANDLSPSVRNHLQLLQRRQHPSLLCSNHYHRSSRTSPLSFSQSHSSSNLLPSDSLQTHLALGKLYNLVPQTSLALLVVQDYWNLGELRRLRSFTEHFKLIKVTGTTIAHC